MYLRRSQVRVLPGALRGPVGGLRAARPPHSTWPRQRSSRWGVGDKAWHTDALLRVLTSADALDRRVVFLYGRTRASWTARDGGATDGERGSAVRKLQLGVLL